MVNRDDVFREKFPRVRFFRLRRVLFITIALVGWGERSAGSTGAGPPVEEWKACLEAGERHDKAGDFAAAIADYTRFIVLKPKVEAGYMLRAYVYEKKGDPDLAIADFSTAIELSPDDADPRRGRGLLYEKKQEREAALEDYTAAIQLDPNSSLLRVERGDVRADLMDLDGALTDFSRAIALAPDDSLGYLCRARLQKMRGEDQLALADYTSAIAVNKTDGGVFISRAEFYLQTGDFEQALKDFQEGIRRGTSHPLFDEIQVCLLRRRLGLTGADAALADAVRPSTQDWPQPVGLFLLGQLTEAELLEKARVGDALTVLDHSCDAYFYTAMDRLLKGDKEGARQRFALCVETNQTHSYEFNTARAEITRLEKAQ